MGGKYTSNADEQASAARISRARDDAELFRALTNQRNARDMQEQAHANEMSKLAEQEQMSGRTDAAKLERDKGLIEYLRGKGFGGRSIKAGEIQIGEQPDNSLKQMMMQEKQDRFKEKQVENLSKREEKQATTLNSAKQLEDLTNEDGKGGVLTNPNAHFKSFGPVASYFKSPLIIGMSEKLGLLPKGSGEERAAAQAFFNDYAHQKFGARVTPEQYDRELRAHGIAGGNESDLAEKAIRQRVSDMQTQHDATVGGYRPDVQEEYKSRYGSPLEGVNIAGQVPAYQSGAGVDPKRQRLEQLRKKKAGN